ncbi:hypothetical protein NCAS_0C04720 [Naumovozyma castellii]|uniref:Ras modification protein ERF4 n=1 Tax=Naumovozyma castellii TaxID=27288 RepID=G0VDA0_NAUCA|nr:hypothetical protein NCAS_0C04720 [Naumovozyma castellii CBS 4309]CCC69462.1 hypothetical protein NCAS_0C04720 [Naumovozyma castellii CBS 4309]
MAEDQTMNEKPLFFNYHEFTERFYADLDSPNELKEHDEDHSISITHFPNVYVSRDSVRFADTRIVRVPRRFEARLDAPQFSEILPGSEPAAYTANDEGMNFVPHGVFDGGQVFGYSSVSPLSMYLSQEQFEGIIKPINEKLIKGYKVYTWYNIMDILFGILSMGIWSWLSKYIYPNRTLIDLEDYIKDVNESPLLQEHSIRIISPKRSGYMSLDFEIPRPKLPTNSR